MNGRPGTLRTTLALLWSVAVWAALWSELSVANVVWGAVIGLLTLLVLPLGSNRRPGSIRPVAVVAFGLHFLWALVRASAVVAWEVVTPRNRIHEGIVAVPLRTDSPGLVTLLANAISLTPGTLTLEVATAPTTAPTTLYVHILHLRTIEEVRADIRQLETLALRAFAAGQPLPDPPERESP